MQNEKVTRSWGVPAAIIAAAIFMAVAAVSLDSVAQTRPGETCMPPVTIVWQPQTVLETRFAAKIFEDNRLLKRKLDELASGKGDEAGEWEKVFSATYLRNPRLWAGRGWAEGWANVLPLLRKIVAGSSGVSIDSVSAIIEYKEYAGAESFKEDVDATCRIKVAFSASPDGNILEGTLRHSRICVIEP